MAPVYYLADAPSEDIAKVHKIVLFDPGASSDMDKPSLAQQLRNRANGEPAIDTCDWKYDINGLLANWLKSDKSNQLIVLTGQNSEMKTDKNNPNSHSTFQGLWDHYFAGLWNQSFADRATVCDYNNMEHPDVLKNFYKIVQDRSSSCPDAPNSTNHLTVWHP